MRRTFAKLSGGASAVFNHEAKVLQKEAAARLSASGDYDYIRDEAAARVVDRINDISRTMPMALDVGCGAGHIARHLAGHGGIETLHGVDVSHSMMYRDPDVLKDLEVEYHRTEADAEEGLPFEDDTFDIVLSSMALHWVNDLPRCMANIRRVLKPDGVFMGVMPGGETLVELRTAFVAAETERDGGVSPHLSPTVQVSDAAHLLGATGFTIPTVDTDFIEVEYRDAFLLMEHLQAMGENNASLARRPAISRDLLLATAAAYQGMHGREDGSVPATLQLVYMIGWKPHASQPKPLRRGSAQASLKDIGKLRPK